MGIHRSCPVRRHSLTRHGAWTAALGAWVLGLKKKETILAISLGVLISATIVTLIIAFGAGVDSIFIKRINLSAIR